MSEVRDRIAGHVASHPGVHFRGLVRDLDLAPGQVQYHLQRLDGVVREEYEGRTHFFTPDVDPRKRRRIAVLRRETARDVLVYLLVEGPSRPAAVADGLEIARSTLEWHLDGLVAEDLVEKRRDGHRVTLAVADEAAGVDLLETVDPSTGDRLVDRFTRLVDGLLE
ncbi:winged helix-turn-helix transcriptional regulator [Halobacteriales archaeon Cl-PHB]